MAGKKFGRLKGDPYANVAGNQSTVDEKESKPAKESGKGKNPDIYRFNLKMPMKCKTYLQEMAWKTSTRENPVTVTSYIVALIEKDMEEHPNWEETLDELNR